MRTLATKITPRLIVSHVFGLLIIGGGLFCFLFLFFDKDREFYAVADASSYIELISVSQGSDDASVAEITGHHDRMNLRVLVKFDQESNLEAYLKEKFCIQGGYCWQPMRDWPGQYEIRVDGVLKPDGSGWDLWSGELTEEQPFPSYSHFVLNTNTNQLHVVVDTGRVTD